jgi:hypothetical protein
MDWKLELVPIPVSDVDRAKAFYVDQGVRMGQVRILRRSRRERLVGPGDPAARLGRRARRNMVCVAKPS